MENINTVKPNINSGSFFVNVVLNKLNEDIPLMEQLGEKILYFFNPDLPYEERITKDWFLMRATQCFSMIILYLAFVLFSYIYKKYDQKSTETKVHQVGKTNYSSSKKIQGKSNEKKPLIERIVPIYNITQVIFSLIIAVMTLQTARSRNFTYMFNEFKPNQIDIATCCWLFYLSKVFDFFDTILITCRKKWNQFTFLHTYHHVSVLLIMWINTSVGYDGDVYFVVAINAIVHFFMYLYYFFASIKIRVPIFFKIGLTYLQMKQFFLIMLPGICVFFFNVQCSYPKRIVALSCLYCFSLFILFLNFSIHTYILKKKKID